MGEGSGDDI